MCSTIFAINNLSMEVYSCHFMEQNRLNHKQLIACHHYNLPFVAVCFASTHHVKPYRALSVGMRNLKKKISRKGHFIDDFNKCRFIYVPSWISTEKKKDFWRFLNDAVQKARIPIRATVWSQWKYQVLLELTNVQEVRAETLLSGEIFIFFCWVLKLVWHHVV